MAVTLGEKRWGLIRIWRSLVGAQDLQLENTAVGEATLKEHEVWNQTYWPRDHISFLLLNRLSPNCMC